MISHEYKYIFIHIPKTGGASVEKTITGRGCSVRENGKKVQHINSRIAKELYSEYWDTYYKFSFVRNPWDLIVSHYFWFRQHKRCDVELKQFIALIEQYNHIMFYTDPSFGHRYECYQLEHLRDANAAASPICDLDFIGRFENLQTDFNSICKVIGFPETKLPKRNASVHKPYWEYYDDESKQIVAEKYAEDIAYFGYSFGPS